MPPPNKTLLADPVQAERRREVLILKRAAAHARRVKKSKKSDSPEDATNALPAAPATPTIVKRRKSADTSVFAAVRRRRLGIESTITADEQVWIASLHQPGKKSKCVHARLRSKGGCGDSENSPYPPTERLVNLPARRRRLAKWMRRARPLA